MTAGKLSFYIPIVVGCDENGIPRQHGRHTEFSLGLSVIVRMIDVRNFINTMKKNYVKNGIHADVKTYDRKWQIITGDGYLQAEMIDEREKRPLITDIIDIEFKRN